MSNTYAIVIDNTEVHTVRIENTDPKDDRVMIHNLLEWLGDTNLGRFEFAPDRCLWFTINDQPLNLIATALLGNRVVIRGTVCITTWTKRGPEAEGIPEAELTEVWGWIDEIQQYQKMYMETHDMTEDQLRRHTEENI